MSASSASAESSGIGAAANARPALELALAALSAPTADVQGGAEEARARAERPGMFFIAAHPRSGTNWLGALLNLHPQVICTGEFTFHEVFNGVQSFVMQAGRAAGREPVRTAALMAFQTFVRSCMGAAAAMKPGAMVVGDHTPRRLRVLLPEASYIVLVRDIRDVVVSWTFNALARREAWVVPAAQRGLFSVQLEEFDRGGEYQQAAAGAMLADEQWVRHVSRQWAEHVRDDLDGAERIDRGELPGRVLRLRYEDLHERTGAERDRVLAFLGVDPALAGELRTGARTMPGFDREDPKSHYRRGVVGDWREKLGAQAVGWVEAEAGTELATLGYARAV